MEIKVTRKDVLSGYLAQLFQYGTGLIVLPVILSKLSAEEIGMNYIMLSVGALCNMADFGFSGQIGRNVTYVLSGAKKIYRNEIKNEETGDKIDFKLLKTIIDASKFLYRRISLGVLILLLTLGSVYMYRVTAGFVNVDNSLIIWILFAISVYFNIYFLYYNSLLSGAALIKEQRMATIYSRITYIAICFALIFSGLGLISVVVANFISPFVARYYSYKKFYSKEIIDNLPKEKSSMVDVKSAISNIWYTAKKSGTNTIGHYVGTNGSMFVAGLYLPLSVTAQWGVLTQLFGIVQAVSMNIGQSYYPEYCKLRLRNEKDKIIRKSSFAIVTMILIIIVGGLVIAYVGPIVFQIIKSNTQLPPTSVMLAYIPYLVVLCNAQLFAMLMTSRNVIPSPTVVIISSAAQIVLTIILLQYTSLGIWSLLLGPFFSGMAYMFWAWMMIELKSMHFTVIQFYSTGIKEIVCFIKKLLN